VALRRELTAKEQREALNVPSLDGDNSFTGTNTFSQVNAPTLYSTGLLQADGTVTFTGSFVTVNGDELHFPGAFATFDLPARSGTLALTADPLPFASKSALYTLTDSDCVIECSGTFTVNLPAASGRAGKLYILKNSGAGVITLDGDGAETIDGSATQAVAAGAVLRVVGNGTGWLVV